MTREECIALLDRYANYNGMGIPNLAGCKEAMRKAVELLSAKPSEDLTTEVKKYFQGLWPGMETTEQCNTDMHFTPPAIMRLANHFYELGKQCKGPVNEDLEEEIDRLWESFADEMDGPHNLYDIYARLARHFANWQKSQMLKDAVGDKVKIVIIPEKEEEK